MDTNLGVRGKGYLRSKAVVRRTSWKWSGGGLNWEKKEFSKKLSFWLNARAVVEIMYQKWWRVNCSKNCLDIFITPLQLKMM